MTRVDTETGEWIYQTIPAGGSADLEEVDGISYYATLRILTTLQPPKSALGGVARSKTWMIQYLWIFGVAGVLPPLPLFYWVYDGEPFVGPWYFRDVVFCILSAAVSVGWFLWLVIHAVAIWKGWVHKMAVVLWAIPTLFSPLCLLVCYLYLHDRRVV